MKATLLEVDPNAALAPAPGKSCGTCTACCYTVPVSEIGVRAFHRCPHLLSPPDVRIGCGVYSDRPRSCRIWSCSWLIGDLPDEYRPDRLGVVLDPLPDVVLANGKELPAAQFWVMPGHEDDWRQVRMSNLIMSMIDLGFIVLWRMRDPETDGQMARAFGRDENGKLSVSPIDKGREQLTGFNSDGDRFVRAQELADRRGR
jgi:hypothetical protein